MKLIIFILTVISLFSCKNNSEKDNSEINVLNDKKNKLKTEINNQLSEEKDNTKEPLKDNSPENIALLFINSYISDCIKLNESVGYLNFVKSSTLTTNNFKEELQKIVDEAEKEDPEMGLDYDPIVPGNDIPDEGFEFKHFDKKTNLIIVKGKNWPEFEVTIKLVLQNGKWLIDGCGVVNIPK